MIKIIYGVKDNSSDCELIFPLQDNNSLLHFVKQSIIRSDASEASIGRSAYSIYCVGDYYVFSAIHIVRDSGRRTSYREYMVILKSDENNNDIIKEIGSLIQQYTDKDEINQTITQKEEIKISNNDKMKKIVVVYYDSQDELKNYFVIKENYRKYETIYFIEKSIKNTLQDPINALKNCSKVIDINDLNKDFGNDTTSLNKGKNQIDFTKIYKNGIVIFLFGFLVGVGSSFLFFKQNSKKDTHKYNFSATVQTQHTSGKASTTSENVSISSLTSQVNKPITNQTTENQTNTQTKFDNPQEKLSEDIQKFLQTDCKTITFDSIIKKIKTYHDWRKTKNLIGFAAFLELMKKNPPTKKEITDFIKKYKSNFSDNDEYVKFVTYLSTLKDRDIDPNSKNISGITNRTLNNIEEKYGYPTK